MLDKFLVDCSLNTVKAFQLKNGFDHLWRIQTLAIEPLMESWIEKALSLNLKPINRFVKSVKNNIDGIINAIKTGITNAVSEGLNSVMQLARSRARGFRNIDNFCNMIYFLGNH
jgi:transposase